MNFNERQRELIILAILVTAMLAVIANATYEHTHFWILYQIPSFLLLVLIPTWRVAVVVSLTTQVVKVFFTLTTTSDITANVLINLAISVVSNVAIFSIIAYFVILLSQRTKTGDDYKKEAEKDIRTKELYDLHLEDIKKSKKNLIESILKEDEKPEKKKKISQK